MLTADVFSSMYSLVISRLYPLCVPSPESHVFHCAPYSGRSGPEGPGGLELGQEAVLWSAPKWGAHLHEPQRKVGPEALPCVLEVGAFLRKPPETQQVRTPFRQRAPPEEAQKRSMQECRKGFSDMCPTQNLHLEIFEVIPVLASYSNLHPR